MLFLGSPCTIYIKLYIEFICKVSDFKYSAIPYIQKYKLSQSKVFYSKYVQIKGHEDGAKNLKLQSGNESGFYLMEKTQIGMFPIQP